MADFFDFDEFFREWQASHPDDDAPQPLPKSIRVGGVEYPLPATLPALTVLQAMRATRTTRDVLESGVSLFGQDTLERWGRAGRTVEEIVSIVSTAESLIRGVPGERLMEIARGEDGDESGEKKAST